MQSQWRRSLHVRRAAGPALMRCRAQIAAQISTVARSTEGATGRMEGMLTSAIACDSSGLPLRCVGGPAGISCKAAAHCLLYHSLAACSFDPVAGSVNQMVPLVGPPPWRRLKHSSSSSSRSRKGRGTGSRQSKSLQRVQAPLPTQPPLRRPSPAWLPCTRHVAHAVPPPSRWRERMHASMQRRQP